MNFDDLIARGLISTLDAWNEGAVSKIGLEDLSSLSGGSGLFLSYASLFSPKLTEVGGGHFLSFRFDEGIYLEWIGSGRAISDVELVMNHVHMTYFAQGEDVSIDVLDKMAEVLFHFWSLGLPAGVSPVILGKGTVDVSVTFFTSLS
ncbi:hypothetical protein [Brevundimonas sp. M20]|uniref:hypothetical protein n=1 Tax=Brevundimonas sp. M20 TaxID=2591463 RepID=UPI001146BA26|nr:hypothetical protein [Brevundimonas sp. M20]QDH72323.1 hypothetical protein FKQ52_02105 [Brevundimonas sp. M20]